MPEEAWTSGYREELSHSIDCFAAGMLPRQTLRDGVIDSAVIDAAHRSVTSGGWESVDIPAPVLAR